MRAMFRIVMILAVLVVYGTAGFAQQSFPSKQVRLLIPYAAGGAVDILGRTLGDELSKKWGPIIKAAGIKGE
ncbi:MAG: hypothetical protein KKA48_03385 [Proteobacteria bacterium]|nr:hypothetical protein [Pseudomonadota bacterium]